MCIFFQKGRWTNGTQREVKVSIISPNFDGIPGELKDKNQWLLWKAVPRKDGSMGKVPKQTNGVNANPTNPNTWTKLSGYS